MPPPTKQAHDKLEKIKQYLSVGMDICGVIANDVLDNYAEGEWSTKQFVFTREYTSMWEGREQLDENNGQVLGRGLFTNSEI